MQCFRQLCEETASKPYSIPMCVKMIFHTKTIASNSRSTEVLRNSKEKKPN